MRRTLWLLLKIGVLVAAAVWLVRTPGAVHIEWQGYAVDTSVGVLAAAALIILAAALLLYRLWRAVISGPGSWRRRRRAARRVKGYRALTRGLVAVAAGDAAAARKQAAIADQMLDELPLALLLKAQAAQLSGDRGEASRHYQAMLARPDMEFLGLKGLIAEAVRLDDRERALTLARRAQQLQPKAPWPLQALFELEARSGDWDAALATLDRARRAGAVAEAVAGRHRAALLVERSRRLSQLGAVEEALVAARGAHDQAPGFVPAAVELARLALQTGSRRPALKALSQAWRAAPHPDLAAAWGAVEPASEPLARVKHFEALLALDPEAGEGHLALAHAHADAQLWGQARRHLERARALLGTRRAYIASAEIARAEQGAASAEAQDLLARAADAEPDPAWCCTACGTAHPAWTALCPHCHAFDTLAWRRPVVPAAVEDTLARGDREVPGALALGG
jgi:HemY protein